MNKKILIALSYGHRGAEPGLANEAIAKLIHDEYRDEFDFLLTQHEVGQALRQHHITPDFEIREHRIAGKYLNTKEAIDQTIDFIQNNLKLNLDQTEIWILSHPTHWLGVKFILHTYGIKPKRIKADIPYDPESHQWWTRGLIRNWIYKIWSGLKYLYRKELKFTLNKNRR